MLPSGSFQNGSGRVAGWHLLDESGGWGGGGRAAEWYLLLLDGTSSSAGSGDELVENGCSVCVWVAFEGGRHPEGIVTGCLASPEHGMGGNHVGRMR
jgi:hypothetical protein